MRRLDRYGCQGRLPNLQGIEPDASPRHRRYCQRNAATGRCWQRSFGDCDGVVVVPADIVDEIAQDSLATTLYDEFAEEEVARGRPLAGLFPAVGDEAKRDFEAWKKSRSGQP